MTGHVRTLAESWLAAACAPGPRGELTDTLPLHGTVARQTPFGRIVGGGGLDARRFTDLSRLQPDRLVTPTSEFFLRTAAPAALSAMQDPWPLPLADYRRRARPQGAHLLECSGNVDPDNFGLLSVAEWDGVPLADVIPSLPRPPDAAALLVEGLDDPESTRSSRAGASWIFPLDTLARTGAFLATGMNGAPLEADHGAPVRLVVPGWYGCSWIKWVTALRLVGPDLPPTGQMIEFSLRTHQPQLPTRALDYVPPVIDLAATPVRVEKRRLDGRLFYRVVGIVWGGERPVERLLIRFRAGDTPTLFSLCPPPSTHQRWSLWDYEWHPAAPGVYSIALAAADPDIRTRRLDVSFYVRRVVIDQT